ncbi:MAG: hypothetical protein ACRDRL_23325, partial [Sciscionella sp.]
MLGSSRHLGSARHRKVADEPGSEPGGDSIDLALLHRLEAGDDSAFAELYSRHADAVRGFAA